MNLSCRLHHPHHHLHHHKSLPTSQQAKSFSFTKEILKKGGEFCFVFLPLFLTFKPFRRQTKKVEKREKKIANGSEAKKNPSFWLLRCCCHRAPFFVRFCPLRRPKMCVCIHPQKNGIEKSKKHVKYFAADNTPSLTSP